MKSFLLLIAVAMIGFTSCKRDDSLGPEPVFTDITITPSSPAANEPVVISSKITAQGQLLMAVIEYKINGNKVDIPITMSRQGDIFKATMPAQDAGTTVSFVIAASTQMGSKKISLTQTYTYLSNPQK